MYRFFLFYFLLLPWATMAQTPIQQAVAAFAADPQFAHGGISVHVLDQKDGCSLAAYNSQQSLIPASILKVVTTATALEVLGADYQFATHLEYDGVLDAEGTLKGNLYIKGEGDPTLGSPHFKLAEDRTTVLAKWVKAAQAAGIKSIAGKVIGDASYFSDSPCAPTWPWEDLGNYYASGVWGLNWQENLYFLHLRQKSTLGATPELLKVEPEIPNLLLLNEMKSAPKGSGDQAYIFGSPYSYTRFVRGTIPVGSGVFKVKGSIPDPPFFAAHELMMALDEAGIVCSGGASSQLEQERTGKGTADQAKRNNFYTYYSPRLREVIKEANEKSVNIYCEALLKAMGKKAKGVGSREKGIEVVKELWKAKGVGEEGFFMEDGSGLSPRNGLSSAHLTQFLYAYQKTKDFTDFYNSLAIGGQSGTLKYLFRGTAGEGRIRGKSGGMGRVRSYTGYATTVGGKKLIFAIIANNYTGKSGAVRRKMERLMIDFCKE